MANEIQNVPKESRRLRGGTVDKNEKESGGLPGQKSGQGGQGGQGGGTGGSGGASGQPGQSGRSKVGGKSGGTQGGTGGQGGGTGGGGGGTIVGQPRQPKGGGRGGRSGGGGGGGIDGQPGQPGESGQGGAGGQGGGRGGAGGGTTDEQPGQPRAGGLGGRSGGGGGGGGIDGQPGQPGESGQGGTGGQGGGRGGGGGGTIQQQPGQPRAGGQGGRSGGGGGGGGIDGQPGQPGESGQGGTGGQGGGRGGGGGGTIHEQPGQIKAGGQGGRSGGGGGGGGIDGQPGQPGESGQGGAGGGASGGAGGSAGQPVPIIPDYLFSNDINITTNNNHLGPASLSPLQRKFEELENENGPLGALLASKAFVQLAFTPLVGYLVGILGCYIPLLIGSCNMLLASILFACGSSYGVLVLARALHGSTSAAIAVSGMCLLAKKLPSHLRVKLMPIAFGGIALGVLIGYPLGGAAYQMIGKSAPFILISILIAFTMVLQIVYFKDEDFSSDPLTTRKDYKEYFDLLKDKQTIIAAFTICISTSTMAILEPCVPLWLLARFDPPPSKWQLGAVFIPDSVGYFIGSHFAGLLPIVSWRTSIIAMVITGLSCYALPLANTMSQLSLPHFGIGLGVGAVDAALVPLLASFVDNKGTNQYGPIYALQQAAVSISYSFGPLLGGQAIHILGFPWLIRIVGFLNLLICPLLLELEERKETIPLMSNTVSGYSTTEIESK